ncbi:MAG: sodium:solute symporter family transporter, partial [Planctomycetota bacterium]
MSVVATTSFHVLDWAVVCAYLAIVVVLGLRFRRRAARRREFFLAARSMPVWAVAISVLATAQSAATFVGGPEQAYRGDLTYLSANLGGLVAVLVVSIFF